MSRFKAVIFDIDGTLTERASWEILALDAGDLSYTDFQNRKPGYGEAKVKLLERWMHSEKATWEHLESRYQHWPVRAEAPKVIEQLKRAGLAICLISGSIDVYTEQIAAKLGVDDYYYNARLKFDSNGRLTNFDYDPDQKGKKLEQLRDYCKHKELEPHECAVVGDSDNDSEMFKATGNGVLMDGFGISPELRAAAWKTVASLSEVPKLLS